jgi:hypothetical protein
MGIVWLKAIAVVGIFSSDSVGQLMQVSFTDDGRALRTQARRNSRIFARDPILRRVES